jgi:hypothetical protein
MVIENAMYFVLGLLAAGLVALMIMPAVWRRAVRLTKKRIEAATPMTMAEFRADKDQLRAEFALSTRRLEQNVDNLRKRLAEQLREINRKKADLSAVKGERDNHLTIIRELEEREGELRRRVIELEKESAELSLKLRQREREYADKVAQLENAREHIHRAQPHPIMFDGEMLTGDYDPDVDHLIRVVEIERKRVAFLERQSSELLERAEAADIRATETGQTIGDLRRDLAERDEADGEAQGDLIAAEASLAEAESRLNMILTETQKVVEEEEGKTERLLAEKLRAEEELEALRKKVASIERTVMADWDTDRLDQAHLRERLNDIAADVARLVYAVEGRDPIDNEESLFDRVQRFADDGVEAGDFVSRPAAAAPPRHGDGKGAVVGRLTALRDLQDR